MRIVIDTNILVGAAYRPDSASRRIVRAVEEQTLTLIVSAAVRREYELVLSKAIRTDEARDRILRAIGLAECVTVSEVPAVTEDRSDDKFLAAALAGQADAIVSSDAHLLSVHPYQGIAILRPSHFWEQLERGER
jgi:putative PIN family toxin of toxin-antitoxin system